MDIPNPLPGGHAMWVRAWSNGRPVASGAGYGLKVSRADRDHHFKSSWRSVRLLFQDGECISVAVSASFWRDCTELRSSAIGRWLIRERLAPWPRGEPPALRLEPDGD